MDATVANADAPSKDPYLPPLHRVGDLIAPKAPQEIAEAGLEEGALAGLAVSSGRSLFVYGPSGNGKSSLGRQVRAALRGDYWIPYCISVGSTVIRLFDEQSHQRVEIPGERPGSVDQRWVRIRRPLIV